jgi:hypothetical protein
MQINMYLGRILEHISEWSLMMVIPPQAGIQQNNKQNEIELLKL